MEAMYYEKLGYQTVKCFLCPQECVIQPGSRGQCHIRYNAEGTLLAETHQLYSAIHFDPIEKKPLYHFYPGKEILSLGSVGCNLHCYWCQNCEISQKGVKDSENLTRITPEKIMDLARDHKNNVGIAFTYNEPSISIENIIEVASLSKENGFKNVMVTNGYIGSRAMDDYLKLIDAFNIDIKAFRNEVYSKYTGSKLEPVCETIIKALKATKHIELTYLVVTGINDNPGHFKEMINWIEDAGGKDIVLHISRYFPRYRMDNPPTSVEKLYSFAELAAEKLNYVYLGNVGTESFNDTHCPVCHTKLITRRGYSVKVTENLRKGICPNCQTKISVCN